VLTALTDAFVDLVLPRCCVGCGRAGAALCPACAAADVHPVAVADLTVVAATRYEGAIRTALIDYKERGRRDLAGALGGVLVGAIEALDAHGAILVPVPSSAAARRSRGGDHVLRLARVAARAMTPATRVAGPLRLIRAVQDSAGLDIAGRAANLHAAMHAVTPGRPTRPAIIVDDIATTGATLLEAARALRTAGWPVHGAAVVAATPRRRPQRTPQSRHVHTWQGGAVGSNVRMT
jgi:predicted amidophosphoribosyltransferase